MMFDRTYFYGRALVGSFVDSNANNVIQGHGLKLQKKNIKKQKNKHAPRQIRLGQILQNNYSQYVAYQRKCRDGHCQQLCMYVCIYVIYYNVICNICNICLCNNVVCLVFLRRRFRCYNQKHIQHHNGTQIYWVVCIPSTSNVSRLSTSTSSRMMSNNFFNP